MTLKERNDLCRYYYNNVSGIEFLEAKNRTIGYGENIGFRSWHHWLTECETHGVFLHFQKMVEIEKKRRFFFEEEI